MIDEIDENTATSRDHPSPDSKASFGFRDVDASEKAGLVRGVFSSVAQNYDVMNDAMSAGIHRIWQSAMIDWLQPRPGMHVLDVAGGTGDIAFRILDSAARIESNASSAKVRPAKVTVCDINEQMILAGRDRAVDQSRLDHLDWLCGNAEQLPVEDSSVDAYTIAFGIRNVTDIPAALREAKRVLKPGGRFMCLEFSTLQMERLRPLYDLYSFNVIPALGQMIAGDADSYRYLVESIRRFPDAEEFAAMIADAGLERGTFRRLTGGLVAIHSAWRI